jgi:hypothetical protein
MPIAIIVQRICTVFIGKTKRNKDTQINRGANTSVLMIKIRDAMIPRSNGGKNDNM